MSEWKMVKLGELYEVHNGLSKGREFFGSGYPFLTFSTVFNNWFLPKELDSLVQSSDKEREACSIRKGDVFITRTSETMNELGMSSVALRDYPNATYNGFTKRLRPITDDVVPEYIGYYLRSPKFRGKFMAFSTMTTRASLANGDLLGMEVELPSKETQKRIAQILFRYDTLIENYQKQIKLLEEAAQRLYKEWFVDLHFPGHENTKIVNGVPEGWEKKKAQDFFSMSIGKTPPRAEKQWFTHGVEGIPWVSISDMKDNTYILHTSEGLTSEACNKFNVKIVKSGAVLLSFKLTVGRVSIIAVDACTNEAIAHFYKNGDSWREYTLLYLRNYNYDSLGNTSGISKAVNSTIIKNMPFLMPPQQILSGFHDSICHMFKSIEILSKQIIYLTEARDRLLPKLMSGEISVETAQSVTSGLGVRKEQTGSPKPSDS